MKTKRKTKCICGEYLFKGDDFCHICQRMYKVPKVIVHGGIVESVEDLPKGFILQVLDYDGIKISEPIDNCTYRGKKK
jgi:hypothetical protein